MQELKKVRNVTSKALAGAPHETLLVLDGTTGQNALAQAQHFKEAVEVTGVVLAKLDGTAKGGMAFTIAKELELPIACTSEPARRLKTWPSSTHKNLSIACSRDERADPMEELTARLNEMDKRIEDTMVRL